MIKTPFCRNIYGPLLLITPHSLVHQLVLLHAFQFLLFPFCFFFLCLIICGYHTGLKVTLLTTFIENPHQASLGLPWPKQCSSSCTGSDIAPSETSSSGSPPAPPMSSQAHCNYLHNTSVFCACEWCWYRQHSDNPRNGRWRPGSVKSLYLVLPTTHKHRGPGGCVWIYI